MKTLDEVITIMDGIDQTCTCCAYQHDCDETECIEKTALHYLKEYRTTQTAYVKAMADYEELKNFWAESQANPPLTFDELKQMEGKPVWVEVLDDNGHHYKWRGDGWYIVKDFTLGYYGVYCHLEPNWRTWTEQTYGDLWQAYRKERDENAG